MGLIREFRSLWPRKVDGLPTGQRALDAFPRFADDPRKPVPDTAHCTTLRLVAADGSLAEVPHTELKSHPRAVSQVADFHCVTTWTARNQRWKGVPVRAVIEEQFGTPAVDAARFAVVDGLDGHRAVFLLEDILGPDVMLAWELDGRQLCRRHGGPLRLVSPRQYGYKNVKHVESITLRLDEPESRLGAKEHLRARVDLEERHSRLPAWLLRWPYRAVVPLTAMIAERSIATD